MKNFRLFDYLNFKIIKKVNDSKIYTYCLENFSKIHNIVKELKLKTAVNDVFSLYKTYIVLKAIENKENIETRTGSYNLVHDNMPFIEKNNIKIYVPFFNEDINMYYDTYYEQLNDYPFSELKTDYFKSLIPIFNYYGFDLFDSNFTNLEFLMETKHTKAFYAEEFETILIISDQGTLDVSIPIFDYSHQPVPFYQIKEKIIELLIHYYSMNRDKFVLTLYNSNFISETLYKQINKLTNERNVKRLKRINKSYKKEMLKSVKNNDVFIVNVDELLDKDNYEE